MLWSPTLPPGEQSPFLELIRCHEVISDVASFKSEMLLNHPWSQSPNPHSTPLAVFTSGDGFVLIRLYSGHFLLWPSGKIWSGGGVVCDLRAKLRELNYFEARLLTSALLVCWPPSQQPDASTGPGCRLVPRKGNRGRRWEEATVFLEREQVDASAS